MIYLDHNATSPPASTHLKNLFDLLNEGHPANPSSPHALGRTASVLMSRARNHLARILNVDVGEIIFTSGGTEANNLGTRAVIEQKLTPESNSNISAITTAFEHQSILKPLEELKQKLSSKLELIIIAPDSDGYISIHDVISKIKSNTVLISIMAANNEIGTIQPVKILGDFLQFYRYRIIPQDLQIPTETFKEQQAQLFAFLSSDVSIKNLQNIHFHVDAVQVFGKVKPHIWLSSGYDSFSLSGHKVGALQGIGAFILKRGHKFLPLLSGGAQEKNRRAGTENIPGIISFGMICEKLFQEDYWKKIDVMQKLTYMVFDALSKKTNFVLNSKKQQALPNTIHFSLLNSTHRGEDLILKLDMEGICVSSGSACSSGVNLPSHVVLAIGKSKNLASNSIRISLGIENTAEEIQKLLNFFMDKMHIFT